MNIIAIESGHPFRASKLPGFCWLYLEVGLMPDPGDIIRAVRE